MSGDLIKLREVIQECLRIQRDSSEIIPYIDAGNALADASARQNHVVFARRGCGKTLLLHYSGKNLRRDMRAVYLNCEDFKRHSFPNVLIEILDTLFSELERHLSGWFGRKKRSKELIKSIRKTLSTMRGTDDVIDGTLKQTSSVEDATSAGISVAIPSGLGGTLGASGKRTSAIERITSLKKAKLAELDKWLPELKRGIQEFFDISGDVKAIFLQIDDFYHLRREDQPFVVDYVHRLCKDVPLYFKIATLRHASILYVDRDGQPIGAQERHDYQPINIDYNFADFRKTREQNKKIFHCCPAISPGRWLRLL